jgi:hypothetical protein
VTSGASRRPAGPARHERPAIDEAALRAARAADAMVAAAREIGNARWLSYLEPLPDLLRDGDLGDLRKVAMRARSAYGPKDSVRDVLPDRVTVPFRDEIDKLLKELSRRDAHA